MHILMIGNSYTFYNDMPEILKAIAAANGKELTVETITKGGRKLIENAESGDELAEKTAEAARSGRFDAVFLQEQSVWPITRQETFFEGVTKLHELLKGASDRFILYETWGRADGSEKLETLGCTHEQMRDGLAAAYRAAAEKIGAEVSPVGEAFTKLYRAEPELELYRPDLSHPAYLGSCLAAAVHYRTLFGTAPEGFGDLTLSEKEKQAIMQAMKS